MTLAGADATTITFPSTSATIARTDAAQTFTGVQTFSSTIAGDVSGSAATVTVAAQPAITSVGTLTGLTVTAPIVGSLTGNAVTATKIATIENADIVQLTGAQTLTGKTLTSPTITGAGAIAGVFTGDLTGNASGSAATVTAAAQPAITGE